MSHLVIFDLDGVLLEAKKIHYNTLNRALINVAQEGTYVISWADHLSKYDGLNTRKKLQKLSIEKGLPEELHERVWEEKQRLTSFQLSDLKESENAIAVMKSLKRLDCKIACCSNSIRKTVYTALCKLGILQFFDLVISNQDVKNPKPHPEMYWKAMSTLGFLPEDTLILEDSPVGILASQRSGAKTLRVESPSHLDFKAIENALNTVGKEMKAKWSDKRLNVLIPMAGAGSRFSEAGYVFPKPLIEVNGKPMIQVVVENIGIDAHYIFVVQKSHRESYNLDTLLNVISENCSIVEVDGMTEGAACTALLAKDIINNDRPLFFANSDQFVEWDSCEFMYKMQETEADGGIVTFDSLHPKWSFASINDDGTVKEVAEKNPISNHATVGYYFWKKGSDFVKYAEKMISENKRVNNEFYVCPVFNEAIQDGKVIRTFNAEKMWGLGTPHDLEYYITNYGNK